MYICFCVEMFSFLLGIYSGEKLLGNVRNCLKQMLPFCSPLAECERSIFSTSLSLLVIIFFFILAILLNIEWYLIVVLIFISVISNDSCGHLSVYLCSRNIQVFCLFCNLGFYHWIVKSSLYFLNKVSYRSVICKCIILIFHFLD